MPTRHFGFDPRGDAIGGLAELWDAINAEPFPGYADTYYERYGDLFKRMGMFKTIDDIWIPISTVNLSQAGNLYEMFAFCASSIVAAVGGVNTMAGLGGVFDLTRSANLNQVFGANSKFNNQNSGHSAEFVHSYNDVAGYWQKLVRDIQ